MIADKPGMETPEPIPGLNEITQSDLRELAHREIMLHRGANPRTLQRTENDPTPEEIAVKCQEIRAGWDKTQRDGRARGPGRELIMGGQSASHENGYSPPVYRCHSQLGDNTRSEFQALNSSGE